MEWAVLGWTFNNFLNFSLFYCDTANFLIIEQIISNIKSVKPWDKGLIANKNDLLRDNLRSFSNLMDEFWGASIG